MIKNRIKMKKQIIISALGAIFLASCADEFDHNYEVGRPDRVAEYAYLNDYQPLKEYVTNDNFKLGIGTTVSDYMKKELVYALVNSNFTETVAGNAMKMGSIVKDNGDMDFGTVTEYVNTATDAGLSVYGHTLAWHAQQPAKWLNGLMKDRELDIDPNALVEKDVMAIDYTTGTTYNYGWGSDTAKGHITMDGGLTVTTTAPIDPWYDLQYQIASGISLTENKQYKIILNMEASGKGTMHFKLGDWSSAVKEGVFEFEAGKGEYSIQFSPSADAQGQFLLLQSGEFVGKYTLKSMKLVTLESPAVEVEQDHNSYSYVNKPDGGFPHYVMGCAPPIKNGALHFEPTGDWSQFFVVPGADNQLEEGNYVFYVDMAASKDASGVVLCIQNGWSNAQKIEIAIPVKAGRHTYRLLFSDITGSPSKNYDCILKPQTADAVLDFYSLDVKKVVKLNSIPLTDQEKKDTLTWAMDKWISGMMEACDGKVKAWDVVNEAISGADKDGDGKYDLQHESDNDNDFFWQNYLGDLDYVRTAVKLARKYGPEDVKLFINDYNLESDWDGNAKLKSLIQWIKDWEADGVTKIDGIGTQMHISYYLDPKTQESKQKAVENAFKLMAESGKLVRISELDMGLVDADGNDVATALVTEEQHKAMAAYYTWIIKTYLSVIPAAQQWGITQWCATDSPADSGWRANSPVGLWDKDYYRKHTYAGFADGLSGK